METEKADNLTGKLSHRLAGKKEYDNLRELERRLADYPKFKPVACYRCGEITFNAKLLTEKKKLPRMQLICAVCGRRTAIVVKRFE